MDTIRDRLNRKRRHLILWMFLALFCSIAGMIASELISQWFLVLGLGSFAVSMFIILLFYLGIRCPKCEGNIGYALTWPPTWNMSVSKKIRFCPFCGVSLDTEMKDINPK